VPGEEAALTRRQGTVTGHGCVAGVYCDKDVSSCVADVDLHRIPGRVEDSPVLG